MSLFSNARNFTINNGSFTNVAGDLNLNFHGKWEDQDYSGLSVLSQKAVTGAFYNSEQRFPPPNCLLGTRLQILEILRNWISNVTSTMSIYWLYGPAGVGKSAVAQTISEEFATSRLAASFFFARADPTRNNLSSFFITISYQLTTSSALGPLLKYPIAVAVRDNPDIIHAVLEQQFKELILLPCLWLTVTCRLTPEQWESLPRLIVIDGLDECIDIASQERLLSIIRQAKSATPPFPFDFLICSRPEPRIRNAFSHQDFHPILDCNDIGDSFESGKDIAMYLKHEFARIRQEHGQSMAHMADDWPGSGIIQQLVQKACGQFIYATTVIKYVGDFDGFPIERLEIILKLTVPDDFESPYPDLDLLYMQILSVCPQRELDLLLDVMAHILRPADIFFEERYKQTSPAIIEGLFFLAKGKVWALTSRLHSVLFIPEDDRVNIEVHHASFIDFLNDRKRSGKYFVNTGRRARHEQVLFYLLKMISSSVIDNWKGHFGRPESEFDDYACTYWSAHLQKIRNLSSKRILMSLNQLDLCGLLNTTLRGKKINLKVYIETLRSCLDNFLGVVQWINVFQQGSKHLPILDLLIKRFTLFHCGFRILIPSSLDPPVKETLVISILVLKNILLFQQQVTGWNYQLEMTYSLLSRLPNYPQWDYMKLRNIVHLPWPPYISPILPLNFEPPQLLHHDMRNKSVIRIDFAEWHKNLGLQCLWIRSEMPYLPNVIFYAKSEWLNHFLKAHPSNKIVQIILDNMAFLSKEKARKALAWAEKGYSEAKVTQQLVEQIQKAVRNGSGHKPIIFPKQTSNTLTIRRKDVPRY